jgi:nucleoside-diphosphate-sugar epimerase
MLEHLKESKKLKAFLYFGSGEIYGNPDIGNIPTSESYAGITNHLSARSCYVESKRFAETLCWNYMKEYNIPVKIIRPVHVYGPGFRENDSRVWADFIVRAARGENIEILGDGLSRRGFCYLADAVLQMMAVIQKGNIGEVYNIGNDTHISIKELADIIARKSERNVAVDIKNQLPAYLQGSPEVSCPSIDKVKQLMPILNTSIEDGIEKSITWFLSLKRNNNEV